VDIIAILIFLMRKFRSEELWESAHGLPARKWKNQDLNSGNQIFGHWSSLNFPR
jgi:hypothetical protein